MPADLETIKSITPFATPFITAIVETWIKPKLSKLYTTHRTDKEILEHALTNKFEEYLQRSYERHSYISILVLQNQRKRLRDIYIPLTIRAKSGTSILADEYKDEFIPKFEKVMITDSAGMGKSTMMKYLFLSCIEKNKGVPIFIELRKLQAEKNILDHIYEELNPIDDDLNRELILKLIKRGDFIFFLDGYDEIAFSQREKVTDHLQQFISKADKNYFIITSRPDSSLASFSNFQPFSIRPLSLNEAFELLRKYDQEGTLSQEIIRKLAEPEFESIKEFLNNPFLVSLLYKSYEFKATIPLRKHIFYRQVYDALFESHDLTKGGGFVREKHSRLDSEDFHRVLRTFGFNTMKLGQIEYDKDRIIALFNWSKTLCPGLDFKESNFLKDLVTTVPLFNTEGNYFRWAHKSLQDYFAAQFICMDAKENQNAILLKMANNHNNSTYLNVLDLCYDIDYKSFRRAIIYDVITKFLAYYEATYRYINKNDVCDFDIHRRKLLTFGRLYLLFPSHPEYRDVLHRDEPLIKNRGAASQQYSFSHQITFYDHSSVRVYGNPLHVILKFLASRKNELVNTLFTEMDDVTKLDIPEPMIIDDHPKSLFNKSDMFAEINRVISMDVYVPCLDVDKCKLLKQQIEEDNARTNDVLLGEL